MLQMINPAVDLGIVCSDFDASLHFYRNQLGFAEVLDIQIPAEVATGACLAPGPFRQVRLQAGQTKIKLMEIDSPPPERSVDFQAGVRWLTFIVDDVLALVAQLKERGVEFMSEAISAPDAKHVICAKGPDGMLIELVQLHDNDLP